MPYLQMRNLSLILVGCCAVLSLHGGEQAVFSGPQAGEKITGFKVLSLKASEQSIERDPVTQNKGGPLALVFIHNVERSLVPLLRVIDEYGAQRKEQLRTEVIFLAADRIAGEQRIKAVNGSLKLKSMVGLSLDGAEGPGNYGLNKECMMTLVVANSNLVTTNFGWVQPGIADAPKVIAALARVSGDTNPPSAETLTSRAPGMARGEMRRENAAAKRVEGAKGPFPGAVPTDEKLNGLLRRFIKPTNDDATVDKVLGEVRTYVSTDQGLRKQAIDGWTRVLHFGDRYGTAYAREKGATFLAELKAQ